MIQCPLSGTNHNQRKIGYTCFCLSSVGPGENAQSDLWWRCLIFYNDKKNCQKTADELTRKIIREWQMNWVTSNNYILLSLIHFFDAQDELHKLCIKHVEIVSRLQDRLLHNVTCPFCKLTCPSTPEIAFAMGHLQGRQQGTLLGELGRGNFGSRGQTLLFWCQNHDRSPDRACISLLHMTEKANFNTTDVWKYHVFSHFSDLWNL